jgi:hypothetical protein
VPGGGLLVGPLVGLVGPLVGLVGPLVGLVGPPVGLPVTDPVQGVPFSVNEVGISLVPE